jgi:hypothetical protein
VAWSAVLVLRGLWAGSLALVLLCSCGRAAGTAAKPDPTLVEPSSGMDAPSSASGSPAQGAVPGRQLTGPVVGLGRADPAGVASAGAASPRASGVVPAGSAAPSGPGACVVSVQSVLDAQVNTGPGPDSPARQATIARLPPGTARQWRGRDHGVRHLLCTYSLLLNGTPYRYRHNAGQSLAFSGKLDPAMCSQGATQREAEARVRDFTRACTALRDGEYWGFRLDPP